MKWERYKYQRPARKQARHNIKMVFLVKALLATATVLILLYDGWMSIPPLAKLTLTGHAKVTDGDTLWVGGQAVRLSGIDAPEKDQTCKGANGRLYRCGEDASRALARLVRYSRVTCEQQGARDRYGRVVARCSVGTLLTGRRIDLSAALVGSGHAVVYRRFAGVDLAELVQLENAARQNKKGLWQGKFEVPEDWRRRNQKRTG
ncbi:probable endonuclease lcl3 [Coccomyxa sp. Obi]|nr:probable endonuclease lcl3 [Coccomyxa sp. Obi]